MAGSTFSLLRGAQFCRLECTIDPKVVGTVAPLTFKCKCKTPNVRMTAKQIPFLATKNGTKLLAAREPTNKSDANAIGLFVMYDGMYRHIGYMARQTARRIFYMFDLEHDVTVTLVRRYFLRVKSYNCGELALKFRDPEVNASHFDADNSVLAGAAYPFGG
ncbi:MAG: hypothetical protein GTO63_08000 [Anaerolineae bacterium]|nr:hypothetical protein [Anaerolineae bacterium]NIN94872.1 hypothetical protein [Anaerolineae bacterium]NIQ77923.1 hypothetical protein [Anaerolineae bacterium]